MNKRERSMFLMIIAIVVIFGHLWVIKKYTSAYKAKENTVAQLESKVDSYSNSASIAELIADQVKWLEKYEPSPRSFGEVQSELVDFLNSSGKSLSFEPIKPKLIPLDDTGGKYRRVKVQITATATEAQIYQWLVKIHQPTKFRAVTQINMKPTAKDDDQITCTLTAEQWLIDSEQITSEENQG